MKSSIVASIALAGTAVASTGYVKIVSHCDEDIHFKNVPSVGETVGATCFTVGATYEQEFTVLENLAGWSMKMSPDPTFPPGNTQQYEYTWQGDDQPVWYDMSYVDGSPYAGKWNFTSDDVEVCNPTDSAYRYSTDDAYGMQTSCPSHVTLTLHLCPDNAGEATVEVSSSSESPESSTAAPSSTSSYSAPATLSASAYSTTSASAQPSTTQQTTLATYASSSSRAAYTGYGKKYGGGNKVQVDASGDVGLAAPTTTTVAVETTYSVPGGPIVTETQVEVVTQVQTMVVTARDAAPTAHAHRLRHEHRHPHGGRA